MMNALLQGLTFVTYVCTFMYITLATNTKQHMQYGQQNQQPCQGQ